MEWSMTLSRHFHPRFLLFLLFGSISFQFSCPISARAQSATPSYGTKLRIVGIPNSGKINDHLFRGAQPKLAAFAELKKLGVTTIVDLRRENLPTIDWERGQAAAHGFNFVHIPVSGWAPPSPEQIAQFLSIFSQDSQQRVFVHCHYGDDRTGVFVAAYRIAVDRWSAEQASKEMYFFGFNWFWHPSMKTFVQNFPSILNSSPSLLPFRPKDPTDLIQHRTDPNSPSPRRY
jgi:protein tyrosine phosphatase (PTP) superfamily phosphohydrolase (DUF442 family)